jgi:hypothetical protein
VITATDLDAFAGLAHDWDALVERCGGGIFHRYGFLRLWREQVLIEQADWDVLRLIDVPQGGAAEALLEAAGSAGLRSGRWASMNSPYIDLPASRAVCWSSISWVLTCRGNATGPISVFHTIGCTCSGGRLAVLCMG